MKAATGDASRIDDDGPHEPDDGQAKLASQSEFILYVHANCEGQLYSRFSTMLSHPSGELKRWPPKSAT